MTEQSSWDFVNCGNEEFTRLLEECRVQLKDMANKVCAELLVKVESNPEYNVMLQPGEWDGFEQLVRTALLVQAAEMYGFPYIPGRDRQ